MVLPPRRLRSAASSPWSTNNVSMLESQQSASSILRFMQIPRSSTTSRPVGTKDVELLVLPPSPDGTRWRGWVLRIMGRCCLCSWPCLEMLCYDDLRRCTAGESQRVWIPESYVQRTSLPFLSRHLYQYRTEYWPSYARARTVTHHGPYQKQHLHLLPPPLPSPGFPPQSTAVAAPPPTAEASRLHLAWFVVAAFIQSWAV